MRPVEILLVVANLVAFVLLVVRLPGRAHWLRHAALIPLPVMGLQLLVEGPRWQLVPTYTVAGLLLLVWLLQHGKLAGRRAGERRTRWLAAGLGVFGLAVSILLPMAMPVFRFPQPAGPAAIGTVTYHWVDADRPEVFTANPNDRRELMVQLWYPAKPAPAVARAPYIQDAGTVAQTLARFLDLPEFAFRHLQHVTSNAIASAPVADGERNYPVLLFLEGLGGYRQMNTFQVEELVSHGYIVAAIDQPYVAATVVFPDGRQVDYDPRMDPPYFQADYDPRSDPPHSAFLDAHLPYLAQDASFTLDQLTRLNQADPNGILTGRLDLQRAGLFGHSLGSIVGAEAGRLEPRLRALLLEDAFMPASVVRAGLQQPTMWITRDADTMRLERRRAGGWPEPAIEEHLTTMRAVYEHLPRDAYYVQVPGMFHVDMNDVPLWSPLATRLGLSGPIGGQRADHIINAYSLAFFDRHLKGQRAALLDGRQHSIPKRSWKPADPSLGPEWSWHPKDHQSGA